MSVNIIKDTKSITDNNSPLNLAPVRTNPFTQNISGEHAYKRTERIAAAVYLVTNNVRYDEPLRQRIRSIGHEMLTQVLALRSGFRSAGHERISGLVAHVRELATHVELLCVAGYLSRQNATILVQAVDELGQFITSSQRSALSEELSFQRDDFVPYSGKVDNRAELASERMPRNVPDERTAGFVNRRQRRASGLKEERQGSENINAKRQKEAHEERRRTILDILKRSGPLGIKDITSNIVGCGEKTVQRELLFLIQKGTVRKKGAKRWSRYFVVL